MGGCRHVNQVGPVHGLRHRKGSSMLGLAHKSFGSDFGPKDKPVIIYIINKRTN